MAVLRIRDVYPGTRILIFTHPKKLSLSSQKYGFEIRDPEKNVFWIPDPRVKKEPDPGSGSATLEDGRVNKETRELPT